jgi:hypothetical protein
VEAVVVAGEPELAVADAVPFEPVVAEAVEPAPVAIDVAEP